MEGEKGTVTRLKRDPVNHLYRVAMDSHNTNEGSTPFWEHELELVKVKPMFKVGDKVRIKEGAHGVEGFSWATPEGFARCLRLAKVDFGVPVEVSVEVDFTGEIGLSVDGNSTFVYVLPEFLEPVEEETPKALEPIEVGGEYWNPGVGAWYIVTDIDWERQVVFFKFGEGGIDSNRGFEDIESTFPGHCAPVLSGETSAESISLSALEEAAKFLKAEDFLQDLLKLAKRLA